MLPVVTVACLLKAIVEQGAHIARVEIIADAVSLDGGCRAARVIVEPSHLRLAALGAIDSKRSASVNDAGLSADGSAVRKAWACRHD